MAKYRDTNITGYTRFSKNLAYLAPWVNIYSHTLSLTVAYSSKCKSDWCFSRFIMKAFILKVEVKYTLACNLFANKENAIMKWRLMRPSNTVCQNAFRMCVDVRPHKLFDSLELKSQQHKYFKCEVIVKFRKKHFFYILKKRLPVSN